jgi:hypothetical protein
VEIILSKISEQFKIFFLSLNILFVLQEPMKDIVSILWMIFQPLLFGLIGAEIDVLKIDVGTVGKTQTFLPVLQFLVKSLLGL